MTDTESDTGDILPLESLPASSAVDPLVLTTIVAAFYLQ